MHSDFNCKYFILEMGVIICNYGEKYAKKYPTGGKKGDSCRVGIVEFFVLAIIIDAFESIFLLKFAVLIKFTFINFLIVPFYCYVRDFEYINITDI